MKNLVTVIIPNYNHAQYLRQRIDSVLNQTYQDFEVIILDDCSTDDSKNIINSYSSHPKVSNVVLNDTNSGTTFKQWEKGILLAKGKYIWIAESDDWCEPGLLQELVNKLDNNENCVIAYVQSQMVDDKNSIIWQSKHNNLGEYINGKKYINEYLLWNNSIFNASMVVFKKECYFKISNEYTLFKFCGDWLFWISIAMYGDVFVSGKVLNYFRKHQKDVSGKAYASGQNFTEELQLIKILADRSIIDKQAFKRILSFKYIHFCNKKRGFTKNIKNKIEKEFYQIGNTNYRYFLKKRRVFNLIKKSIKLWT